MNSIVQKIKSIVVLISLLFLTGGVGAWAQEPENYSGTYYIKTSGKLGDNKQPDGNYYLCPTEGWCYYKATNDFSSEDTGMPFLTSYQCLNSTYGYDDATEKAVWIVEKHPTENYYYIKRASDGKYVVLSGQIRTTSNANRMRLHLEALTNPDDNALFAFSEYNGGLKIQPKTLSTYLTVNGSNFNTLKGEAGKGNGPTGYTNTAGIIGIFNTLDDNSKFYLESTVYIVPPTITNNNDGTFTITAPEGTIYYTTDGSTPTTTETEKYTDPFTPPTETEVIKAIAVVGENASGVKSMPLHTYTYYIINRAGDIAIKKEVKQGEGKSLSSIDDIPADIRSSYLAGETASFYTLSESYTSVDQLDDEAKIDATPSDKTNIYVTYTTDHLSDKFLRLRGARAFNIKRISDNYCAYDDAGTLAYENANNTQPSHLWNIGGSEDPYDVEIKNVGTDHRYMVFSTPPTLSLAATATTKFILMEGSAAGDGTTYEQVNLMAATGTRANDFSKAEVKVYPVDISVTYKLIDRQKKLIATIESNESELKLPDEWISPLVSAYHFYKTASIVGDVYTLSDPITSTFEVESGDPIYVNYEVSDDIDLDGRNSLNKLDKENKTYMLRFLNGESFYQEDGSDGIMTETRKAVYPYNNGDVTLYVYGAEQWQAQLAKGASTRSRWLWCIEPANNPASEAELDPYHVKISSKQEHIFKEDGVEIGRYPSYLRTYKPTDYASVVTNVTNSNPVTNGGAKGGPADSSLATEYMIVGTESRTRLVTLNPVEGERRTVNSFEQYWKNNPTVQGILSPGNKVTTEGRNVHLTSAQKTEIEAKGWHVYEKWALSAPWVNNGDVEEPTGKQYWKEEHASQTISMGSGNFVFEEVSLEPQVILLDNHGWELMRVPLSKTDVLSTYNSPMVEQYKWYSASAKIFGYHKYEVVGTPYHTSTSLANVPTGSKEGNDFYVTYTVKLSYSSTYTGAARAADTKATTFLLKQGGKYAKISSSNIVKTDDPASIEEADEDIQWYLKPNFDIDREMGYLYEGETGAQDEAKTKDETEQDYYIAGKNGFDPYNVQIQSKYNTSRYFTANSSAIALSSGVWTGTSSQVSLQNLTVKQHATGYDQTRLNITNATFMVVSDANGNMRLMPRFDNTKVANSDGDSNPFTVLATQHAAAEAGDKGTDTQTLWLEHKDAATEIHSRSEITDMNGHYLLAEDFSFSEFTSLGTSEAPFTGLIDGQYHTYSGLNTSLVAYANGAVIRNLILDNVNISGGTNVGIICNEATGDTRIYNCGILATNSTVRTDESGYTHITSCTSSVRGSNYVGGIVGLLNGSARVINCFSYANITGGAEVGGIVGHNNVATTSANLKTMVMNCMFYGNITGSTNKAPIYNGENILNKDDTGVGNYNYFYAEAPYVINQDMQTSNCALMAETRFLQRFEFFRNLQNSHRELAAWWATGDRAKKDEMAKWVLLPSQIGSSTPYPVLAKPGYYPSVVNIDAENAPAYTERNKGGKMGTLTVNIQMGNGAQFAKPDGAEIVYPSLTLNITDKDPEHFNFNYYKVQLPYYNEVGTKNYTHGRVVTGWKIVSITGGTPGTYSAADNWGGYNFADRNCTNKDKYSVSGRVFSQGAYWDVPEGVTAITIEPYWAKAVYLADANADVVYDTDMGTVYQVPNVGGGNIYTNGSQYSIAGNNQVVYTSLDNATANTALNPNTSHTVNDYAVVLVGNYHYVVNSGVSGSKPYTVTSIDLDGDNEPDYSLMLRNNGRNQWHPVKWDFINIPGLGMAQKSTGGAGSYNLGIIQPIGWYETTNTSLFRVTQFEYDRSNRGEAPLILQGGVMEQWVSGQSQGRSNNTIYFHVGGNVWFKEFHRGTHQDQTYDSKHPPVSVTGGDFDKFYLTGMYRADVTSYADNAECYINGGRFGIVAGAAMEGIGTSGGGDNTGNVTWQIQNADIKEFYGGGFNADSNHRVEGNITTTITGGKIDLFCGGPKFGDMNTGKTVTTTATGCEFGTFFGAGFGGSSYSRRAPNNKSGVVNTNWNNWVSEQYTQASASGFPGISTQFSYQFIPMSDNVTNVARLFVEHVLFSLATTRNVTSTLTDCTITGNFYGGGSLGKVEGPATSTLTGCTVKGNVFGAGYSASLPTVEVDSIGFRTTPLYYTDYGTYRTGVKGKTTTYKWEHGNAIGINKTDSILYTTENLDGLGAVTGNVSLTLNNTTVGSNADTTLDQGNVFGGGEESSVGGNTTVTISGGNIYGSVFGGGDIGSVGTFTKDDAGKPTECTTGGKCTVTVTGAANIGHDNMQMPDDWGHVFGAGRGTTSHEAAEKVGGNIDHVAYVDTTEVTIGVLNAAIDASPLIKASVYGGSENGHVLHGTKVVINSGQIGVGKNISRRYTAEEWSSGNQLAPCASWDYVENGDVYDPYAPEGGWGDDHPELQPGNTTATDGHTYYGNVFGGGSGVIPVGAGEWQRASGLVEGSTKVIINGGHILTSVYGGNEQTDVLGETSVEMNGGTVGVPRDSTTIMTNPAICYVFGAGKGDKRTAFNTWTNVAKSNVTIKGGTIYGSVYGGGEDGHVLGDAVTSIEQANEKTVIIGCNGKSGYDGNVFGGGQGSVTALTAGVVGGNVDLKIKKGSMYGSVYGGGRLASVGTHFEAPDDPNYGKLNNDGGVDKHGNISANLTGGTIDGDVFGGGMGTQEEVDNKDRLGISRNVWLNLNKDVTDTSKGCVVKGNIFGCNNMNTSPKGKVTVHVYATQNEAASQIANTAEVEDAKVLNRYDVKAVYGGGNMAAYVPDTLGTSTNVIIDGCSRTSIKQVYGGGNAASTPATSVTVNGTFEIEEVFGGGNGKDDIVISGETKPNPGANVGFYDYSAVEDQYPTKESRQSQEFKDKYVYGTGAASVNIFGGKIHRVFGGSNTKGNVKTTAITLLDESGDCEFCVDEAYGGGKSAPMDAEAKLLMACIPGLQAVYGGAEAADVHGDVTLTVTNGTFDRVFGGNNLSGTIDGAIKVNIEEVGCRPIIIGELYGGGNQAAYSVYGYYDDGKPKKSGENPKEDPEVNVKSFTSIGSVYGGGFGESALMVGSPTVNINEVADPESAAQNKSYTEDAQVKYYSNYAGETKTIAGHDVILPSHVKGKMGSIYSVFGGGKAAQVMGNTTVNIGTTVGEDIYMQIPVKADDPLPADCYTKSEDTYTPASGTAAADTTYYKKYTVLGVDIRDNVYGGGDEAEVTGNASVNVGKKKVTTP